jgi:curli biogenesis system outer membrane secretion channel CsgG
MRESQQSIKMGFVMAMVTVLCGLAGCAAPTVKTQVTVADFSAPNGQEGRGQDISRWIEHGLIKVRHEDGKPFFTLVARDQLQKVMKEQGIQNSGLIEPAKAKAIGRILGVDAIITGNVSAYRVEEAHGTEQRQQFVPCGGNTQCLQPVSVPCVQRDAYVLFNVNFIDVQTGAIEVSESPQAKLQAAQCQGDAPAEKRISIPGIPEKPMEPLQSAEAMLKKAADQAVEQFVNSITPHLVEQTVVLKDKVDGGGMLSSGDDGAVNAKLKAGVEYAMSGMWPKAMARWEEALKLKQACSACLYNLGYGHEMGGNFPKALELYERASSLNSTEPLYRDAEGRIEKRMEDKRKLDEQSKNRKS